MQHNWQYGCVWHIVEKKLKWFTQCKQKLSMVFFLKKSLTHSSPSLQWLRGETCDFVRTFMLAYTKYHFVPKFMVKNDTFAELLSFSACPSTTAHLMWSGWRMERRSVWEEKGGLLFGKQNEEANNLQELTLLLCLFHSSSFSRVNPLALAQFPLRAGPSDSISICLNYKIPTPYSLSLAITYTLGTHCPLV